MRSSTTDRPRTRFDELVERVSPPPTNALAWAQPPQSQPSPEAVTAARRMLGFVEGEDVSAARARMIRLALRLDELQAADAESGAAGERCELCGAR